MKYFSRDQSFNNSDKKGYVKTAGGKNSKKAGDQRKKKKEKRLNQNSRLFSPELNRERKICTTNINAKYSDVI